MVALGYENWSLGEYIYVWNDILPWQDWSLGEYLFNPVTCFPWQSYELPSIQTDLVKGSLMAAVAPLHPVPLNLYKISGVTRDSAGNPLGNCLVRLLPTDGFEPTQEKTSDANGNYTFYVPDSVREHLVVAFKSGAPNVMGATVRVLKGVAA